MSLRSEILKLMAEADLVVNTETKAALDDFLDTVNDVTAEAADSADEDEEGEED